VPEPELVPERDGSAEHEEAVPVSGVAPAVVDVGLVLVVVGSELVEIVVVLVVVVLVVVVLVVVVLVVVVPVVWLGVVVDGVELVLDGVEVVLDGVEVVLDGVELAGVVVSELVAGQPALALLGEVVAAGVVDPASTVESVYGRIGLGLSPAGRRLQRRLVLGRILGSRPFARLAPRLGRGQAVLGDALRVRPVGGGGGLGRGPLMVVRDSGLALDGGVDGGCSGDALRDRPWAWDGSDLTGCRGSVVMRVRPRRLLDLDGAGGDERGSGQPCCRLGRDRADARRQEPGARRSHDGAGSGGRGASNRGRLSGCARAGCARAGAGGMADVQDRELAQKHKSPDREHRGERLARLVELSFERRAALARAQMATHERPGAALQALGYLGKLHPHLLAREQPRLRGLGERHAGTDEQRFDARHGRLHRLGDLLVGQGVHLAQHERRPLRLREACDVADEQAKLLAVVDLVGGGRAVIGEVNVHRVDAHRLDPPQVVEAAVARDPVQPGPHVDRAVVLEDCVERGGEHLLEHVLGILAGPEQVSAKGQQTGVIARHQHLEGGGTAAANQSHEAFVGLQPEQRRARVQADSSRVSKR
jgi:hypothetical protein